MEETWINNYLAFSGWVTANLGERPSGNHSLDRIDNEAGYFPGNLRWATGKQQANNTRRNVIVEFKGERKTVSQWAQSLGLSQSMLRQRLINNWPLERALSSQLYNPNGTPKC
jgi:hypothetical protein